MANAEDFGSRTQPGIVDVARRAGVSTATVSRALSEPDRVAPETRARVMAAVDALGYVPNAAARHLRARRSMTVLVAVPRLTNPFFAEIVRSTEDHLARAGYGLIIVDLASGADKERHLLDLVGSGRIDGVVSMTGHVPEAGGRSLEDLDVPVVGLCARLKRSRWPSVVVDDRAASAEATGRLLALCHRTLLYLAGPEGNTNEIDRWQGFGDALAAMPEARGERLAGEFSLASGEAAGRAFLAMPERPTGVVASSDEIAIGFLRIVREADLVVPRDVSVIGFDGIEMGRYVAPCLSTMVQPHDEIGRRGAETLLRMMQSGERMEGAIEIIKAELFEGASLGPPTLRHRRQAGAKP